MTAQVLPLPRSLGTRYVYIDAVVLRACRPLPPDVVKLLRGQCYKIWQRPLTNPAPGGRHWQILITRPTSEFWNLIATPLQEIDGHINQIEFALDYVLASEEDARMLEEYLVCHTVQRWHGKRRTHKHETVWYWSERRWVSNQPVVYADKPCRITGELDCVHLEWRIKGVQAVYRTIGSVADLEHFDHEQFWQNKLVLAAVDPETLGRRTRRVGQNRRAPVMRSYGPLGMVNADRKSGNLRLRNVRYRTDPECELPLPMVQAVKDTYKLRLGRDLVRLDPKPLLLNTGDYAHNL